jgi:hypothetical protein
MKALLLPLIVGLAAADRLPAAGPAAASTTNAPAPAIPAIVFERRSVFDSATPGARDPFYPRAVATVQKPTGPVAAQPVKSVFSQLSLRGLVANRLAVINGRTFGPGEEASVALDTGGTAKIRVHEITEKTVSITLSGETEKRVLRSSASQK